MTFASAPWVRQRIQALVQQAHPQVVILECSAIPDFEYTALQVLIQAEQNLREAGITLWLTALNPEALNVVNRSPLGKVLTTDRMFFNLRDAVATFEQRGIAPESK